MGQNSEELSTTRVTTTTETSGATTPADIEQTRANLTRDIDELSDKVSPAKVVERRKEAAKGRLGAVKDKVMGSGSGSRTKPSLKDKVMGSASSATGSVRDTVAGSASSAAYEP